MIYINFVERHYQMLHAKFQDHRPYDSGEDFFFYLQPWRPSWSCDLDHETIYINFLSQFLKMLHLKFGFDWPSRFIEDV